MAGIVCNLAMYTPGCFAIRASSPGIADGQITVSAIDSTSAATIRYSLNVDTPYPFGQTSGNFTGLLPGTYTVYARNSSSCRAQITLVVDYVSEYAIRYRLPFKDPYNNQYKLEIEDSEYESATVNDMIGGMVPVRIVHRGESEEDIFYPVISSLIEVSIISETDQQYIDFYTFDERRFRAKVYKWNGASYDLYHVGYLTPMLYSEPYVLKQGYEISISFTDGLADLVNYDFSDDGGNTINDRIPIFNAINYIINKTGIALNYWETVNVLSSSMASLDNSSALEQGFIDPKAYQNTDGTVKNCREVLGYLMEFLGAKIYQSNGRWNIDLISEKTASTVLTRKRTDNFGSIGSSSESPRVLLRRSIAASPRVTWKDQSQVMSIPHTWGTIELTHNFGLIKNNLLAYGNFEDEDIENGQLKGWQITNDLGTYDAGIEALTEPRGTSENSFYAAFDVFASHGRLLLNSLPFDLYVPQGSNARLKLKFDLYSRPIFTNTYIYFDFSVKLNGQYLTAVFDANGDYVFITGYTFQLIESKYHRVYVDEPLSWKTVNLPIVLSSGAPGIAGDMEVEFRISSNPMYDYADFAALRAANASTNFARFPRVKVLDTIGGQNVVRYYEYEKSDEAESVPDVIRPTNYGSTGYVWKLKKTQDVPADNTPTEYTQWLQSLLIDNVALEYYPEFEPPQTEETITEVPHVNVKQTYEKTLYHGDIPEDLDDNYRYLNRSYLTLADGTILSNWKRRGVTEDYTLTELLGKMIRGQYQELRWKETGTMICPDGMLSFWNTVHEVRTGKIYQLISLVQNLKFAEAEVEMIETLAGGAPLDESTDPGGTPGPIEPPVSTRVHSIDFSTDFN